jgi:HEAT repeat protein
VTRSDYREVVVRGLLAASLLLTVLAATAPADPTAREKALALVDSLIESGKLEEAEHRLAHLLGHHPSDSDLLRLRTKLRIRQGKLEVVLREGDALLAPERRGELRAACWRIVEATVSGSPEELPTLAEVGDTDRARALLEKLALIGSAEQKRVAVETLARMGDAEALKAIEERISGGDLDALLALPDGRLAAHAKRVLEALRSPEPPIAACAAASRLGLDDARPLLRKIVRRDDPHLRVAAAGALLAMGDGSSRVVLEKVYATGKPIEVVPALTHLAAYPKSGHKTLVALLKSVEEKPSVPRLKPDLMEIVLAALGRTGGHGVRRVLERRLKDPTVAMAAARALGRLGDSNAAPGILAFLREPPKETGTEAAADGGLGFLGRSTEGAAVARAVDLQPRLVGALALLRVTR